LPKDIADAVRGKRGAPNIWRLPASVHKEIYSGAGGGRYNHRWMEELDRTQRQGREITVNEVLRVREQLIKEFELEKYRP
jgi:hypothetical protein